MNIAYNNGAVKQNDKYLVLSLSVLKSFCPAERTLRLSEPQKPISLIRLLIIQPEVSQIIKRDMAHI